MAMVQVSIVHDMNGQIVSINRPAPHIKAVVVAKDGQSVLVTKVDEDSISTLITSHRVNMVQKSLVTSKDSY
jgi:hypothetical protein